jgi:hypothetical protein
MTSLNYVVSFLLACNTGVLSLFYLGSFEEHALLMQEHLASTFALRFCAFAFLSLVGAASWWAVNVVLLRLRFIQDIKLGKTAAVLAAGPVCGSLVGALIFCLLKSRQLAYYSFQLYVYR